MPAFKEAKDLLNRKYELFVEQGADALDDIRSVNASLPALREAAAKDFPLSESEVVTYRGQLAVHDVERSAVERLQGRWGRSLPRHCLRDDDALSTAVVNFFRERDELAPCSRIGPSLRHEIQPPCSIL